MEIVPSFLKEKLQRSFNTGELNVLEYFERDALGLSAAKAVAGLMRSFIKQNGRVRMVFASAMSQTEFLAYLGADKDIDWNRVYAFHLDEYRDIPLTHPQSFSRFLKDRLFDKVGDTNFFPINSENPDSVAECERYAGLLTEAPIDIMILGIGETGHLAFIDPPFCDFNDPNFFKITEIDDGSRVQMVHDGCFEKMEEVPKFAYTMTVPACLSGTATIIIVPSEFKAKAIKAVIEGPITKDVPASILRTKKNAWLLIDKDSAGLLSK